MGYSRAGFDVTGVDLTPQPDYPFEFIQADALGVLRLLISGRITGIDAIHASPPCQGYATLTLGTNGGNNGRHPLLIEPTRELLDATGLPYVIENVMGAPVRRDLVLCGEMFGLGVIRHRCVRTGALVDDASRAPTPSGARPWVEPRRLPRRALRHGLRGWR